MVGKAGFDAWDLSMFPMCVLDKNGKLLRNTHPFASKLFEICKKIKADWTGQWYRMRQSHAPFPSTAAMQPYLMRAIECGKAGGKICIIHPQNDKSAEEIPRCIKAAPFKRVQGKDFLRKICGCRMKKGSIIISLRATSKTSETF